MKSLPVAVVFLTMSLTLFSQNGCCNNRSRLADDDVKPDFCYFNNEWIAGADVDMVDPDSISEMELKDDAYGNHALFLTVSSETLSRLKSIVEEANRNDPVSYDPVFEFQGGNDNMKRWIDENIRIPKGYEGYESVMVRFFVQPDGSVSDATVLRPSGCEAVNAEALRLVNSFPRFKVKYLTSQRVPFGIALPITFRGVER